MINHDVSNSLNAINLTAILLERRAPATADQVAQAMKDIQGLCRHVAGMMKGFVAECARLVRTGGSLRVQSRGGDSRHFYLLRPLRSWLLHVALSAAASESEGLAGGGSAVDPTTEPNSTRKTGVLLLRF